MFDDMDATFRRVTTTTSLANSDDVEHLMYNYLTSAFSPCSVRHAPFNCAISPKYAIAERLNQEKVPTAKGKPWTARRVMDFRKSNQIPSTFVCKTQTLRSQDRPYLSSAEAAERLGVSQSAIQKWYRLGLLPGKRDPGHSVLWVQLSEELETRLNGSAVPDPRMVTVRTLCKTQKMSPDQVLAWAQSQGHTIFRLRAGKLLRFYILPTGSSTPQL